MGILSATQSDQPNKIPSPAQEAKCPPAPAGKIYVTKRYPYRRSLIYFLAGGNWTWFNFDSGP